MRIAARDFSAALEPRRESEYIQVRKIVPNRTVVFDPDLTAQSNWLAAPTVAGFGTSSSQVQSITNVDVVGEYGVLPLNQDMLFGDSYFIGERFRPDFHPRMPSSGAYATSFRARVTSTSAVGVVMFRPALIAYTRTGSAVGFFAGDSDLQVGSTASNPIGEFYNQWHEAGGTIRVNSTGAIDINSGPYFLTPGMRITETFSTTGHSVLDSSWLAYLNINPTANVLQAVTGFIEPSNGLAWTRAINAGSWSPLALTSDLDCTFVKGVDVVARIAQRLTLTESSGFIAPSATTHPDGDLNTSRVTVIAAGSGTPATTVQFDYTFEDDQASIAETSKSVQGGNDGGGSLQVLPVLNAVTRIRVNASPCYAILAYNADGSEYINSAGSVSTADSQQDSFIIGDPDLVWVERIINSGSLNHLDPGAGRLNLTTTKTFGIVNSTNPSELTANVTFNFWNAATAGNLLASKTVVFTAEITT